MPIPWLIGAAVVAAAAAVAKAVSDDDSPSSSDDEDDVRREQEREAKRQRKYESLTAQLTNLKKDRLEEASELLAHSANALEQFPEEKIEFLESPSWRGLGLEASAPSLSQPRAQGTAGILTQFLGQPRNTVALHTFESALSSKVQASSAYAQSMGSILELVDHSHGDLQERDEFLVNLQLLESLYGAFALDSEGQRDLAALQKRRSRLDMLRTLKQQLEQQG